MLNNIKTKERGFTIVELLIVIVVIAILAAITIVAYNGIQNRAKASTAQSLASQVAKKAEAYNTVESSYPTYAQLTSNTGAGTAGNPPEAKLDDTSKVQSADPSDEKKVGYKVCVKSSVNVGFIVTYYDASASGTKTVTGGTNSGTGVTCS